MGSDPVVVVVVVCSCRIYARVSLGADQVRYVYKFMHDEVA